jgi:hypothetical protein
MVYEIIYNKLIEKRKLNPPSGYTEKHHIIPRSLGGSNKRANIIILTAREHFIAHYLLFKMQVINTPQYHSMRKAFLMMGVVSPDNSLRYISGLKFSKLKEEEANYKSSTYVGDGNSQYGTMWICDPLTNHNKKIKKDEEIPLGYYVGRGLKEKVCPCCHKTFHTSKGLTYCCVECYEKQKEIKKVKEKNKVKEKTLVCGACGKEFLSIVDKRGCSKKCSNKLSTFNNKNNKFSSKLTKEDVLRIRSEEFSKSSLLDISNEFNITITNAHFIRTYKTWKDVSE